MSQSRLGRRFPLSQHTIGPFFPADYFQPGDNDLTRVSADAAPTSQGEAFALTGVVMKEGRAPVANAILEMWQADASGRFNHPADPQADQADPDFLGWGRAWSTGDGVYDFHSIRPGGYDDNDCHRAPHLNVCVMGIGLMRTVETTLYFPDFPDENAHDPVLSSLPEDLRHLLVMHDKGVIDGVRRYGFDILLRGPRDQETPFFET